ncbi:MAG: stage II sporulation protein M [Gammaproteobacteria bacterium]|nr:stage II sporulation protein M [Gammaproteobacteria bacterium]
MRQQQFEQKYQNQWDALGELLASLDMPKREQKPEALVRLPHLYRQVCNHYAISRSRRYSPALVRQLKELVWRGHRALYHQGGVSWWRLFSFIGVGFPRALRQHSRYFWLATTLFLLPAVIVGVLCYSDPDLIYSIMSEDQVANMESMYDPSNRHVGRSVERSAEIDFTMFGFYIYNNISIGFRTFAAGILAGVGTVFLLLFNGIVIGGVAGHLTQLGFSDTFWPFVSGHGAFELTAIVICGAGGLMLAHGVVAPGQLSRLEALKRKAREALSLVMGAALMLLVAAFIEAFWSSSGMPNGVKFSVAGGLWLFVILYLGLAGRERHGP